MRKLEGRFLAYYSPVRYLNEDNKSCAIYVQLTCINISQAFTLDQNQIQKKSATLRYLSKKIKNYQLDLKTPGKKPKDANFLREMRESLKSLEKELQRPFKRVVDRCLVLENFFNELSN